MYREGYSSLFRERYSAGERHEMRAAFWAFLQLYERRGAGVVGCELEIDIDRSIEEYPAILQYNLNN